MLMWMHHIHGTPTNSASEYGASIMMPSIKTKSCTSDVIQPQLALMVVDMVLRALHCFCGIHCAFSYFRKSQIYSFVHNTLLCISYVQFWSTSTNLKGTSVDFFRSEERLELFPPGHILIDLILYVVVGAFL